VHFSKNSGRCLKTFTLLVHDVILDDDGNDMMPEDIIFRSRAPPKGSIFAGISGFFIFN